jgi:hypothetical protein
MEKQSFDFEAFKKQAATRIKNGETLLGRKHSPNHVFPCGLA